MDLFFCSAGNRRFAEIAINAGFEYGAQLPNTVYFPPAFADQDYKAPNLPGYLNALRQYRPRLATVLDWERPDQFEDVMAWAEEIAAIVDTVIVIPKVVGRVDWIPDRIGGKPIRLGYSIPTRYGGTAVPPREFGKRPVHLLGGSPHRQMRLSRLLNAVSADGNYIQKMAVRCCQFWTPGSAKARNRYFPRLAEAGDGWIKEDATYEAFARSCENVLRAWGKLNANDYSDLPMFAGLSA